MTQFEDPLSQVGKITLLHKNPGAAKRVLADGDEFFEMGGWQSGNDYELHIDTGIWKGKRKPRRKTLKFATLQAMENEREKRLAAASEQGFQSPLDSMHAEN